MPPWTWTGSLRPARVAPKRIVPENIAKPDWASNGVPAEEMYSKYQSTIPVSTPLQAEQFRAACELGRRILDEAHRHIKPGVTTDEIDRVCSYRNPCIRMQQSWFRVGPIVLYGPNCCFAHLLWMHLHY